MRQSLSCLRLFRFAFRLDILLVQTPQPHTVHVVANASHIPYLQHILLCTSSVCRAPFVRALPPACVLHEVGTDSMLKHDSGTVCKMTARAHAAEYHFNARPPKPRVGDRVLPTYAAARFWRQDTSAMRVVYLRAVCS